MLNVFVGYDHRQPVSSAVARHSISRRCTRPVAICDLNIETIKGFKRTGLTPFTYTRYLAPWLCDFEGYSIFVDADVLCLGDISELLSYVEWDAPVSVVKNKRRFEWPSLMLFNNAKCTELTPHFVSNYANIASLDWSAPRIGVLPAEWNHLVGYDEPRDDVKLIHYTQGVPAWPETKGCEHADAWWDEYRHMCSAASWEALMGQSVHREAVQERLKREAAE